MQINVYRGTIGLLPPGTKGVNHATENCLAIGRRTAWVCGICGSADHRRPPLSAKKISDTFVTRQGVTGFCPDVTPGPLTIRNNRVDYTSASGRHFQGTVNSQGQLLIKGIEQPNTEGKVFRMNVTGTVDGAGTAHVRQVGNSCSYDFMFRKQ
jgi:hypothetical protein